jgi:tRNA(Arg) A34 adenosine deaminase TadA
MNAAQSGGYSDNSLVLSRILWAEAESVNFSQEDIDRLLAPIKARIMAGEFSRPRRQYLLIKLAAPVAAAAVLAASLGQAQTKDAFVYITDEPIPLSHAFLVWNRIAGQVVAESSGIGGIQLVLMNAESLEDVQAVITADDGSYEFVGVPEGTYRIKITLPPDLSLEDQANGGGWVALDREIKVSTNNKDTWEGLEIRLCRNSN